MLALLGIFGVLMAGLAADAVLSGQPDDSDDVDDTDDLARGRSALAVRGW